MTAEAHDHGMEELCEAGYSVYARALREGSVTLEEAEPAPCLVDFGLLQPNVADMSRLEPVSPAMALHQLLLTSEERIAHERRREVRLVKAFEPILQVGGSHAPVTATPAIRVLSGLDRINLAITQAMAGASEELLTIQPRDTHTRAPIARHEEALDRDQALLDRGGRIRALYQHTLRHAPTILARYERLRGDVEARALDEVTERLIIVDRTVAFVPATKDRTLALEVRQPALVDYLATAFDRLWRLASPLLPKAAPPPSLNGITPRQHAIAALLVEGHTDTVIAERLGMNVRTTRLHIAKLAATLGSDSRAQLGYLIAESGMLRQDGGAS